MNMPASNNSLLLVDDDETFVHIMGQALAKRGFQVISAGNVNEGRKQLQNTYPDFAVIDLNMPGESGLVLVTELRQLNPNARIIVLTGYASIPTAVEAIKLGAIHYLAKPADADDVIAAFRRHAGDANIEVNTSPLSINRLEWEHIQRVLQDNEQNISATARALGMHRRTLQRKLQKRPKRS